MLADVERLEVRQRAWTLPLAIGSEGWRMNAAGVDIDPEGLLDESAASPVDEASMKADIGAFWDAHWHQVWRRERERRRGLELASQAGNAPDLEESERLRAACSVFPKTRLGRLLLC